MLHVDDPVTAVLGGHEAAGGIIGIVIIGGLGGRPVPVSDGAGIPGPVIDQGVGEPLSLEHAALLLLEEHALVLLGEHTGTERGPLGCQEFLGYAGILGRCDHYFFPFVRRPRLPEVSSTASRGGEHVILAVGYRQHGADGGVDVVGYGGGLVLYDEIDR